MSGRRAARSGQLAFILWAAACNAHAADVALVGIFPGKAVLVVDGGAPKTLAPGQSWKGVTLVSIEGESALVEVAGARSKIALGAQPIAVRDAEAPSGTEQSVTLISDARGHFVTMGSINGATVTFLVDTGASSVAMGPNTARQIGLDYLKGRRGMASTANGVVPIWNVKLDRVTVGGVTLRDVEGTVVQADMQGVLLGMSFLNRMEMRREGAAMVLKRRY